METKTCRTCRLEKQLSDFSKDKHKNDGHHTKCKACVRDYKLRNADAIREYKKAYRAQNSIAICEYMKEYRKGYREKNMAALSAASSEWNRKNAERFAEIRRASRLKNAESSRAVTRNRRAKLKQSAGSHTASDIKIIGEMQRWKCACCRVDVRSNYHVDHIIPIAGGGDNDKTNLQLLCPPCNQSKNAKHPVDFMQSRGFLC